MDTIQKDDFVTIYTVDLEECPLYYNIDKRKYSSKKVALKCVHNYKILSLNS